MARTPFALAQPDSQIVNDGILDYLLGRARTKASRAGQIVRFTHVGQPTAPIVFDTDEPRRNLDDVMVRGWNDWIVHPSGLCLPSPCVNWFWFFIDARREIGTLYRLGTGEQAARFARAYDHQFERVVPVHPSNVHGTCVRRDRPAAYQMFQARSFPEWAGV